MGCSCSGDKPTSFDMAILEEVEFLMVRYDKDRDDRLSYAEARPYMIKLNREVHKYSEAESERDDLIMEMFKEIDADGDNHISRDELYSHIVRYQALHDMPLSLHRRTIKHGAAQSVDSNFELEIKFRVDELFEGMNARAARTTQIFKEYDTDRDNKLSLGEAKNYLIEVEKLSDTEAERVARSLDKDNDGYLSQYDIFNHFESQKFVT